ncbi:hypothetical protein ACIPW5_11140 [Streptomyces sp. NPDC090077]|uniref:hypothetical protein n=1 Tax=Streptomyces sp. NPDC090077 TaxID=3365938 RepID=UPI0037F6E9CC
MNADGEEVDMPVPATAPDQGAPDAKPPGALSRLIQEALDEGFSYQQLADRSRDPESGEGLSKQYLNKLVNTPPANPPNPTQLRALAVGLRKSERRVKEAAAEQWLDYTATELAGYDEDVRIIVGHLAGVTKQELRQWRAMIEAAERAKRED